MFVLRGDSSIFFWAILIIIYNNRARVLSRMVTAHLGFNLILNLGVPPKIAIIWASFGTKTDHQFLDFHRNSSYFNLLYSSGCKTFGKQTKFVMSTDMAWTQQMFAPFWCFWVRWEDNIEMNCKCKLRLLDTVSKHSPDWIRETHDRLLIKC